MYLKSQKNARDDLTLSNRIFFNRSDWNADDKYVEISCNSQKFIFKADIDDSVNKGCCSMGGLQRKWLYCGVSENVGCKPYSLDPAIVLTEVIVEIDLFSKNTNIKDPVDTDKMGLKWLERFVNTPLTIGQLILFNFNELNFLATIKSMKLMNMTTNEEVQNKNAVALLVPNSVVKFARKGESRLVLAGRSLDDSQVVNIINPNWDFNSIGVGGVDKEFSVLFRRAFLSRLLPTNFIEQLGIKHVRGMLLYGPPGTGKTLMARQIGRMLNAREPKIVNGPSILDKYVGESEANIRKLFADAEEEFKRMGNNSALHIIIFDEIDAICKQRGSLSGGSGVQDTVVNQLLSKMDGVDQLNNILVIGMTNRRDMIDEALLRPGRMGVQIEIALPDEPGRLQIFEIHTQRLRNAGLLADDVVLSELAKLAKNFSGAEIEDLIKAAFSNAQVEKFDPKKGMTIRQQDLKDFQVHRSHFLYALENDVKPFFASKDPGMEEFIEAPLVIWGERMADLLAQAGLLVRSIRHDTAMTRVSMMLHGPPGSGLSTLAVRLAHQTDFAFIRIISLRSMVGFSESARCLAIKKMFDDALRAPDSVIILDDIERLIDYSSIGPRFSVFMVNNLISLLLSHVPAGKKLFLIGTTHEYTGMRDLRITSAFMRQLRVPTLRSGDEVAAVLAEQQDLLTDADLVHVASRLNRTGQTLNMGVKSLMDNCKVLRSVDANQRADTLVHTITSDCDEDFGNLGELGDLGMNF